MLPAEVQKLVENEYARTSIRVKAKQLSRRKDFGSSCREDIEQGFFVVGCTCSARRLGSTATGVR